MVNVDGDDNITASACRFKQKAFSQETPYFDKFSINLVISSLQVVSSFLWPV